MTPTSTPTNTPRPTPRFFGAGSILPLAALLIAGTTIALASLGSLGVFRPSSAASAVEQSELPSPVELAAAMARVGITPETLTAAGVQTTGVTNTVADARSHLDAQAFAELTAADEAWKRTHADADRLGKLVRGGYGTDDNLTALRQAETALQNAEASRTALLNDLRDAATERLTAEQIRALSNIEANTWTGLDTAYAVNDRTQEDWVALRDALANLRIASKLGEEADYECSQLVTQTNAESEVAAARSHLDARLPQVRTAYDDAIGYEG